MRIHEADLPGVGRKFWLHTHTEEKITILRHSTGKREIYSFLKGEEFPSRCIELTEEEARQIGAVLVGEIHPKTVERLDVVLKDLIIDWVKLEPGCPAAGKRIGDLQVRKRTGVSIVTIIRGEETIPAPGPEEVLQVEDVLLVVAHGANAMKAFRQLLKD